MSKLVSNYTINGSSTTDEYGTFIALNRFLSGDVIEGFVVVANGSPNMTVLINPGSGRITTGTYPSSYGYLISHDTVAGESVTIATAAASPRIDYIVAYIDTSVAGSTSGGNVNNTNNVLKFASVAGTPAGSPVVPTTSQITTAIGSGHPYIIIAQIAIGISVTQITNSNITDIRRMITPLNGLALGAMSYVDTGLVWSALTGLNGAMTAGLAYLNIAGAMTPASSAAVATHGFTASNDTYISINAFGVVTYSGVANGGSAPALPANSVWISQVVTNGSAITSIRPLIGATNPQYYVTRTGGLTKVVGWGAIGVGGLGTGTLAVTLPVTFRDRPRVVLSYGGDSTVDANFGSGAINAKQAFGGAISIVTNGFTAYVRSADGTNWPGTAWAFFQFTAEGVV